jgi:hypothetical protein
MSPRNALVSAAITLTAAASLISVPSAASANPGAPGSAIPAGATVVSSKPIHLTRVSAAPNVVVPNTPDRDCSGNVSIYRIGTVIYGSITVWCPYKVDSMRLSVGLYRSRWFGWEGVGTPVNRTYYNFSYASEQSTYGCAGTGTHDFLATGSSYIVYQGAGYSGSDSDEMDNQSC